VRDAQLSQVRRTLISEKCPKRRRFWRRSSVMDGFQVRRRSSHRRLVKRQFRRTWAFHDGMDLGAVQLAQVLLRTAVAWASDPTITSPWPRRPSHDALTATPGTKSRS
jgi:predicted RNA binding protein YcfA (HicA-like mRNA interferase family)